MAHNGIPHCVVKGCDLRVKVKMRGLCLRHYKKWLKYGDPTKGGTYRHNAPKCEIHGCQGKPYARDMCHRHYKAWWKRQKRLSQMTQ
ncbi:hypothetical protein Mycch_2667 [Mycolicibacterium chubuense NBB4]|uniref:Uncharacterized protein n=1 Tax=Mycolicibacterium chubuense (strain NBB4) TaxID=710421 RepID=I4BJH7_MYCCN|nr:hypothetical protein Mycch_2667 [Mycolicibacterium chubuense NBB4]